MISDELPLGGYEEVLLIRHGATAANAAGKYSGISDLPLSISGTQQIELRREELINQGMNHWFDEANEIKLISSPLKRCLQTAELFWPHMKPLVESNLIETDFGSWEGLTYDQLKSDSGYRSWLDSSPLLRAAPPGGESGAEIMSRLESFWINSINLSKLATTPKRLAIVSHGGVIMYLMTLITGKPGEFYTWQLQPGGAWLLNREGCRLC